MIVYSALFKCRLCGEIFSITETGNRQIAMKAAISAAVGEPSEPQAPMLHDVHICEDGDMGIADFLGFKRGLDEPENASDSDNAQICDS